MVDRPRLWPEGVRTGPPGRLGRLRFAGRVDGGHGVQERPLRTYDGVALVLVYAGGGLYGDAPADGHGADREVLAVLDLLVALDAPPPEAAPPWLQRSQALLAAGLDGPLDLAQVAAEAGLPYETWRKRFRAATGRSPARFRRERRVEAAATLLRTTALPQREIAARVGFHDEYHLSRRFREIAGVPPSALRRGWSGGPPARPRPGAAGPPSPKFPA